MDQIDKGILYSCIRMRRQLNQLLTHGNLSQGEYLVLRGIKNAVFPLSKDKEKGPRAAKLSDMLELSRPSITRILNNLEGRQLIERSIDKSDRRGVSIQLTDRGQEALDTADRRLRAVSDRLASGLGPEDTDKLIQLMDKLSDIYREILVEKGVRDDEE